MHNYNFFKLLGLILATVLSAKAQTYPPPVGQPGTTAMYKDSSAFVNWVTGCHVTRGYQNISNTSLGYASAGDSSMALGVGLANGVVSLGDGGSAICTFQYPIKNGAGFDFAVFENSFDDSFLELALVEVSSDGINYVRFAAHSLTDTTTQTGSFGATDATKINNLAGKYRGGYGTPFDLQELSGNPNIDINAVTHVKLIDVVGSVNKAYAKRDSYNNMINDPWPTGFASGGFDLDAIGVINQNTSVGVKENSMEKNISIYPNPVTKGDNIILSSVEEINSTTLYNFSGQKLFTTHDTTLATKDLSSGIYFLQLTTAKGVLTKKIVIR
ncbi:MAG: T9SS type A sorting domain-containing protein [Bacteroidetes bacterium]|nr:T9SS type A sorting domain-containing protein [Bacteroidota bacterium]